MTSGLAARYPSRCQTCSKLNYVSMERAMFSAVYQAAQKGYIMEPYRCPHLTTYGPRPWHLRAGRKAPHKRRAVHRREKGRLRRRAQERAQTSQPID